MNKIFFVLLLITVASSKLAIDITTISSADTLSCFVKTGIPKAFIEVLNERGEINKNFFSAWISAQDAGFSQVDAIAVANDHFNVDSIAHALPGRFRGVFWLKVVSSSRLWSLDKSKRISYLDNLVLALKQHGISVGIFSDENNWSGVMPSEDAGSDTLKAVPVWYVGDNSYDFQDFSSWAGFGTWKTPYQKQNQGSINVCKVIVPSLHYYV